MKILVCGGRDYWNWDKVQEILTPYFSEPGNTIIQGGAQGADALACKFAKEHAIPMEVFRADWKNDHDAAGPLRNYRMLREGKPDLVIAFPGESGTAHMVRIAKEAGVPTIEVEK